MTFLVTPHSTEATPAFADLDAALAVEPEQARQKGRRMTKTVAEKVVAVLQRPLL